MPQALESDWVRRHRVPVFRYLLRRTGNRDTAEDLTQEVFLRALRAADSYEERDRSAPWIFRIARNLILNRKRDAGRQPAVEPFGESRSTPDTGQEMAFELWEALDGLDDQARDLFLLREAAGLNYAELAGVFEITPDAVRSRLHRARLALRDALRTEGRKESAS